jgi:anaerobic magnesium-protoporphyrin IX monomethyl ester cyclase
VIVLYNPPSSANRKPILPMSLLAIGGVLEGQHDYRIVDGNLELDPVGALDRVIRETNADTLAVTVMPGPQLSNAVPACRRLKQLHPNLTIVWGGYFPTQHYEVCVADTTVDVVVRGHGEMTFRQLLDAQRTGEDVNGLLGLAYREPSTGKIVANGMPSIPHPDQLPDFPYHRVELARYIRPTFMGRRTLPHHSSYGCPFRCNFCAVVNMVDGRWLAQSAERVASIVRRLAVTWRLDAVEFYDNNFFVHEARTVEFAERIRDLELGWWGEARIDTLLKYDGRSWATMRDSGLRMVFLGAESGSDETLRRMNKGGTASTEKTLEIARKTLAHGIVPEFSFVLGNPPDPETDVRQTLEFIRKIKRINPRSEIILYMYTPVPLAGELYDEAKASGFAFPTTLDGWLDPAWQDFSQRRSANVPWLDDPLRRSVHDFERVLNAYYPTMTNPHLQGPRRWLLRALSAWRYHARLYRYPFELRLLHRLVSYQRPETSGF